MPIEIRELVIRATVDPGDTGKGVGNCASSADGKEGKGAGAAGAAMGADQDLVQACVREVMRILEEKRER